MTSAGSRCYDFSWQTLLHASEKNICTSMRSHRVRTMTFFPYTCCIYHVNSVQYRTLVCLATSSGSLWPCMQFLFVRPGICFRLPLDSTSQWTPLPSANTSYCQACSGLTPYSHCPCRAHLNEAIQTIMNDLIFYQCKTYTRLDA